MIPSTPHSLRLHNSAVNNELLRDARGRVPVEGHHAPGIESEEADPGPQTSASGWGLRLFCMISVDSKSSAVRVFIIDFVFFFEIQRFVSIAKTL